MTQQSIYEYAGGAPAFSRLVERFYEKARVDALLAPLFARFTEEHVRRVALWLGEVFGGRPLRTGAGRPPRHPRPAPGGLAITEPQRARRAALMIETAGEELPAEPKLQRRFAEYIEWGTGVAREASQPGYVAPPVQPVPLGTGAHRAARRGRPGAAGTHPPRSLPFGGRRQGRPQASLDGCGTGGPGEPGGPP